MNLLPLALVICFCFTLGLLHLVKPLWMLRLFYRFGRWWFHEIMPPQNYSPPLREMMRILENEPARFARRYRGMMLLVYATGVVALLIGTCSLLLLVMELLLPDSTVGT